MYAPILNTSYYTPSGTVARSENQEIVFVKFSLDVAALHAWVAGRDRGVGSVPCEL